MSVSIKSISYSTKQALYCNPTKLSRRTHKNTAKLNKSAAAIN